MNKLNFLVFATHHGAFLTLQSIMDLPASKRGEVMVIIPQHQIDKYATYPEEIFKNYEQLLKEFVGKKRGFSVYVSELGEWMLRNPFAAAARLLHGKCGMYLVMQAGAIFNKDNLECHEHLLDTTQQIVITACCARPYEDSKTLNMYHMVGMIPKLPPEAKFSKSVFLINSERIGAEEAATSVDISLITGGILRIANKSLFSKYDELIDKALPSQAIAAHGMYATKALASYYWPQAMAPSEKLTQECLWACATLPLYAKYAKKVGKNLPQKTLTNILNNGQEAEKAAAAILEVLGSKE